MNWVGLLGGDRGYSEKEEGAEKEEECRRNSKKKF